MKQDIIIIGSGLVGSATAKYLTSKGMSVLLIDEKNPNAASKCSFGIFKVGWINEKINDYVNDGLELVANMAGGISEIEFFDMKREKPVEMQYVNCANILDLSAFTVLDDKVTKVTNNQVHTSNNGILTASKAVILATGAFTDTILKKSGYDKTLRRTDVYWGATLDVNMKIEENRIMEWAPYKQCVLLKTGNKKFVFGDGASVKNPSKQDKRIEHVSIRLVQHLNDTTGSNVSSDHITAINEGYRPYLPKDEYGQYVKKHDEKLYSATGGAKNTTILCGYMAQQIFKQIKAK